MDRDTKIGTIVGLVATIGIPIVAALIPHDNRVIDKSDFPVVKFILDENNDGIPDTTLNFLYGSRIPNTYSRKSTEEERDFYRTHQKR